MTTNSRKYFLYEGRLYFIHLIDGEMVYDEAKKVYDYSEYHKKVIRGLNDKKRIKGTIS